MGTGSGDAVTGCSSAFRRNGKRKKKGEKVTHVLYTLALDPDAVCKNERIDGHVVTRSMGHYDVVELLRVSDYSLSVANDSDHDPWLQNQHQQHQHQHHRRGQEVTRSPISNPSPTLANNGLLPSSSATLSTGSSMLNGMLSEGQYP